MSKTSIQKIDVIEAIDNGIEIVVQVHGLATAKPHFASIPVEHSN
jgi:hypothetical protein